MLSNLVPSGQSERDHFNEEKSKLMNKLNQLRMAEESTWKKNQGFSGSEKKISTQPVAIR